jgi:hypothetical protein
LEGFTLQLGDTSPEQEKSADRHAYIAAMSLAEHFSGSVTPLIHARSDDLVCIHQAVRAQAEEALAYSRQLPCQLMNTPWGRVLNQGGAERKWFGAPKSIPQHCHLLDLFETGNYGVHAFLNRELGDIPAASFVAFCPHFEIPAAASYLRLECLGENVNIWSHAIEIRLACEIPPRAVNDGRLPGYSEISSGGTLLRLDQTTAKTLWRYLNLAGDPLVPQCSRHQLGADFFAFYAAGNDVQEPARMILGPGWSSSSAERELKRWLKSGKARLNGIRSRRGFDTGRET